MPNTQVLVFYNTEPLGDNFSKDQFTFSNGTSEDMVLVSPNPAIVTSDTEQKGNMPPDTALDKPQSKQREDQFSGTFTAPTSGSPQNPSCVDLDNSAEASYAEKGDDFSKDETFPGSETQKDLVPMPQDPRGGAPETPEKVSPVNEPKSGTEVFGFIHCFSGTHSSAKDYAWSLAQLSTLAKLGAEFTWTTVHQRAFELMAYGNALPPVKGMTNSLPEEQRELGEQAMVKQ